MEKSSQSKLFFFLFAVQDFLDKAKKDFEEQWSKNAKVRKQSKKKTTNPKLLTFVRFTFILILKKSVLLVYFFNIPNTAMYF